MMADKIVFKMYFLVFLTLIVVNDSLSLAISEGENKCGCNDVCERNFTTNDIKDLQKVSACQRGCRFYSLVLHASHEMSPEKDFIKAREGCLESCSESYTLPLEISACKAGCSAIESSKLCETVENQIPQISYSFLIGESDVLIHPGEPEPDDSLTDPGLRNQLQKSLVALLDSTPKIPEIRFRNLPIEVGKQEQIERGTYKCPKFYGLDSKFEFRNGKIIIGDLYLFVGVFVFVIVCFVLGQHVETKNLAKQLREARLPKKEDLEHTEPLLHVDVESEDVYPKDMYPKEILIASDSDSPKKMVEHFHSKINGITLVFHDDEDDDSKNDTTKKDKPNTYTF